MKFKSLILLSVSLFLLFSCDNDMLWTNPNDSQVDTEKVEKICAENKIECGTADIVIDGFSGILDCGKCSDGFTCIDNKCRETGSAGTDSDSIDTPSDNDEPVSDDSDSGDSEPDNGDSADDSDSGEPEPTDTGEPEPADHDADSGDSTPDEGNTDDDSDSAPENDDDSTDSEPDDDEPVMVSRVAECSDIPENAIYNTVDEITQTLDGEEWIPSNESYFSETPSTSECRFKCDTNSSWNSANLTCVLTTQQGNCSAKPAKTVWNDGGANGKFDQTWNGSIYTPESYTSTYNETAGICRFKCASAEYSWNGSDCKKQIPLGNICTGQNRCYNNTAEIPCPTSETADFYGQDAQYAKAGYCYPQSFTVKTVSGKNIVVDNNTGLTWEQSPSTDTYTWDNRETHCNELNSSNYGGKSNWRVPNPLEFLTIADNSKSAPATNYFTNMPTGESDFLWTSEEYGEDTSLARAFNPHTAWVAYGKSKSETYNVLCVSGNEIVSAIPSDFETSSDEKTFFDKRTGLIWQMESVSKTWQEAFAYCKSLNNENYSGYSDWRLPNKNEISSLLAPDKSGKPYSNTPAISNAMFWSSSTHPTDANYAWIANFAYGNPGNNHDKTGNRYVRCVRSEKINDPCNPNPCNGLANSTQICTQHNAFEFSCGCNNGYFWNGQKCAVLPECSTTSGTPCKDLTSQLTWSKKAENTMAWQTAVNYCNNYTEGGLTGWRLPNIDELKTLLINADKILTECDLSETNNCLSMSNCWSCETCMETGTAATSGNTCSNWGTSYSDGRYSKFKETGWFWSSSTQSANSNNAFGISFNVGGISDYARSYDHDVRCVR